ncbi:CHAD domain-containing protein [Kineococcus gynurae]|uniref:CHAD domain-containing protein n=1 Tax=Kineococcus gynurae TaxID=452979 RepID=A0ABV5LUV3_9ACTN
MINEPGQVHVEIEVKYDLAPGAELPTLADLLADLPEAGSRGYREGDLGVHDLEATYFDTEDLRLAGARTTLRRRTGGDDAGWHLKTPGDEGARIERRVPLGRAVKTVPVALRREVEGLDENARLVPVARISTRRRVHTLLDAAGTRLLELCDDTVRAERLLPAGSGGRTESAAETAAVGAVGGAAVGAAGASLPGAVVGATLGAAAGATVGAVRGDDDGSDTWREVELELLDGDRDLFDAVDARLRAAGLTVAGTSSKLQRVLSGASPAPAAPTEAEAGSSATTPAPAMISTEDAPVDVDDRGDGPSRGPAADRTLSPAAPPRKKLGARSPAGDVLVVHLAEQVQQILDQDPGVRADADDSVHKMRVATRRLRSALRTFGPLLEGSTKPLREELKWLAAELGEARDAEVLRNRLVVSVAALDEASDGTPDATPDERAESPEAADGVPQRVHRQLEGRYRVAHDRVLEVLDSERYQSLLDRLQELVERPDLSSKGRRRAEKVLPRRVRKAYTALAELVAAAEATGPGHDRDELLHEARKQAKQVRYAAEAVTAVFGKDAKTFAKAVTAVQEVLGEHQDSVVTREQLRELAAGAPPEVAFAYGRLHAHEELHAAAAESDFEESWDALQAKRLHRWLR